MTFQITPSLSGAGFLPQPVSTRERQMPQAAPSVVILFMGFLIWFPLTDYGPFERVPDCPLTWQGRYSVKRLVGRYHRGPQSMPRRWEYLWQRSTGAVSIST